jgi:hypothetical protein
VARIEEGTVRRSSRADEIDVEALPGGDAGTTPGRTTIRVVTVGRDIYVRAIRGVRGKWYRSFTSDAPRSPTKGDFPRR